jgi:hypothetical protein
VEESTMNDSRQFFSTQQFPTPKIGDIVEFLAAFNEEKPLGLIIEENVNGHEHLIKVQWLDTGCAGTIQRKDCKVV